MNARDLDLLTQFQDMPVTPLDLDGLEASVIHAALLTMTPDGVSYLRSQLPALKEAHDLIDGVIRKLEARN